MDPKKVTDTLKAWLPVAQPLLTLVLFVVIMFGGDSTKIADSAKKAKEAADLSKVLQGQLVNVQGDVQSIKTLVQKPLAAGPHPCPCGLDCPCHKQ